ncbi:MAG TPA: competence protein ComEA [Lachnospiraceae bacterium]|nr:competence protein ComEA [Lachnospiraceae bacterium]
MEKNRLITIAICFVFIVLSGIFYLRPATDGKNPGFIKNTEESTSRPAATGDAKDIAVYICGAVKHPGVYSFTTGQRLCDAVKAAGGFKKSAARSAVNLARRLSDSEQITIPTKKQAASRQGKSQEKASETASFSENGLININTASREELMTLPGIGMSKADAVIGYRSSNKFNSIEDIKNVTGIKDGVFNQIKDQITV